MTLPTESEEKEMYHLKQWSISNTMYGRPNAHGIVYGHYRLSDGMYIHTNIIREIYLSNDGGYIIRTNSESLYEVQDDDIAPNCMEQTREWLDKIMADPACRAGNKKEVTELKEEFEENLQKKNGAIANSLSWAENNLKDGELYLLMANKETLKAIFRHGRELRELRPNIHVGMFQDSVLITDWEGGKVDFRYFPMMDCNIEPYHWSDGLNCIYIYNIGERDITFVGTGCSISCLKGQIVKIDHDKYKGEGLFSPDAVNGKGLYSDLFQILAEEN